jgi:hypothetical protein
MNKPVKVANKWVCNLPNFPEETKLCGHVDATIPNSQFEVFCRWPNKTCPITEVTFDKSGDVVPTNNPGRALYTLRLSEGSRKDSGPCVDYLNHWNIEFKK